MEIAMKKQASWALATAVLLAATPAAVAANMQGSSATPKTAAAVDSLHLSRVQQKVAWIDLSRAAQKQNTSSALKVSAGAVVPNSTTIKAVTKKAASDVPMLRSYDFAVVQGRLLIINPSDRKIAEVIRPGHFFA
jgi:Protein of unknown function (DUF1236)